jgi:hypothetical protein
MDIYTHNIVLATEVHTNSANLVNLAANCSVAQSRVMQQDVSLLYNQGPSVSMNP